MTSKTFLTTAPQRITNQTRGTGEVVDEVISLIDQLRAKMTELGDMDASAAAKVVSILQDRTAQTNSANDFGFGAGWDK